MRLRDGDGALPLSRGRVVAPWPKLGAVLFTAPQAGLRKLTAGRRSGSGKGGEDAGGSAARARGAGRVETAAGHITCTHLYIEGGVRRRVGGKGAGARIEADGVVHGREDVELGRDERHGAAGAQGGALAGAWQRLDTKIEKIVDRIIFYFNFQEETAERTA